MLTRRAKRDPVAQGGWNLFHSGNFGVDVASPMTNIYLAASCDQAAPGWPCDEQIEALKARFARAATEAERRGIAAQIQQRAMESVPYVNLAQLRAFVAYRRAISGVLPSSIALYWNVEKGR
jgi:peptide/nickel transport system substrate-binding protein